MALFQAGDFFVFLELPERGMTSYTMGHAFARAIDLARKQFPDHVTSLECEWAELLVTQRQWDAACNHFIEAGEYLKVRISHT